VQASDDPRRIFKVTTKVAVDAGLSGVDDSAGAGKPSCDWNDADTRKSISGKFDGYKGAGAIDPDSEIIIDIAGGPPMGRASPGSLATVGPVRCAISAPSR